MRKVGFAEGVVVGVVSLALIIAGVGIAVAQMAKRSPYVRDFAIKRVKDYVHVDTMGIAQGELLLSVDETPLLPGLCQSIYFDAASIAAAPRFPAIPLSSYEWRYRLKNPEKPLTADQKARCSASFHPWSAAPQGNATAVQLYDGDAWRDQGIWKPLDGITVPPGTTCDADAIRVFESDGTEWHYTANDAGRRGLAPCIR